MKNINFNKAFLVIMAVFITGFFLSCDMVALGKKVDLYGPVVQILTPISRQQVDGLFIMSGTVKDDDSDIYRLLIKARYNKETSLERFLAWSM